ncbi:hypothetical protein BZG36_03541 [Bifiguratus adelaidae]|uniref:IMS import disulfide relay-system CHCH-CHCH-like Cx9C domain-containing protein n=1 Tax=Bifiguratus adelaidae TaxID=1938954 RepID=A0A261XZ99_9FUNG|nr:hypothetical protein BZG36_03541 [Bifiguratus adelaidae]
MENTLEQVAKNCALQLEMYQKCIDSHPDNWSQACFRERRALTKCSEDNVGILKFVKRHCGNSIDAYDKCLADHAEEPEKCMEPLKDLWLCTEASSAAYNRFVEEHGREPTLDGDSAKAPAKPEEGKSTSDNGKNVFTERTNPPEPTKPLP